MNRFILSIFVFFLIGLVICEILLKYWQVIDDERNLLYEYHEELGWIPKKGIEKSFVGSRKYLVKHNSNGFREKEFSEILGTRKRILILGDSFAYGYDSEVDNRFSNQLSDMLPNYSIVNMGVSGYSTDQEYMLLKRYFDQIDPDIVYLLYNHDDRFGNSTNYIFGGYYKPYFQMEGNHLELQGVPVPMGLKYLKYQYPLLFKSKTAVYLTTKLLNSHRPKIIVNRDITFKLLNAMKDYIGKKHNCIFKLGVIGNDSVYGLDEYLDEKNMDWILLDDDLKPNCYVSSGHWTPHGNQIIAERIKKHIISN